MDKELLLRSAEISTLTNMTNALARAHGIGVSIFGSNRERIIGPSNHTRFCQLISSAEKNGKKLGEAACHRCDLKHFPEDGQTSGPYTCHAGLTDFSVPIVTSDGTVIGAIFGGQVIKSNEPKLTQQKKDMLIQRAQQYGIEPIELLESARELRVMTKAEIIRVIQVMEAIAKTIAELVERRSYEHDFLLKLTSTLDLNYLTEYIIQYVRLSLKAEACSIFLDRMVDGQNVMMLEDTSSSYLQPEIGKAYYERGKGLTGWVAATGKPLLIDNVQDKKKLEAAIRVNGSGLPLVWVGKHNEIENPRSKLRFLAVPLFASDGKTVTGVIRAIRKPRQETFTETDLNTLQGLALPLANALESARKQEKARSDVEVLRQAAISLNTRIGWREVLDSIIKAWFQVKGNDQTLTSLYVLQHSADQHRFTFLAGGGAAYNPAHIGTHFDDTEGLAGQVLTTGKSYLCKRTDKDPNYKSIIPGLKSAIVVPVISGSQIVGTLSLGSSLQNAFSEDDERLLESFGRHVGIAFDTVRLYEQSRLPVEVLNEVLSKMGTTTFTNSFVITENHKKVAKAIAEATREKLNVRACSLFVLQQERLQLLATTDENMAERLDRDEPIIYEVGEGLTGSVAKLRIPICVKDVTDEEEIRRVHPSIKWAKKHSERIEKTEGARAFLGVPIEFNNQLVGVIRLSRPRYHSGFLPPEEEALKGIAVQAAILLQFVQAITDRESITRAFAHDAGDPATSLLWGIRSYYEKSEKATQDAIYSIYCISQHLAYLVQTYTGSSIGSAKEIRIENEERFNINGMLKVIYQILRRRDAELAENVRFRIDVPEEMEIRARQAMLHIAFYNLLKNAWHYCKKEVQVEYKDEGESVAFYIRDDGPGFDPSKLHVLGRIGRQGLNIAEQYISAHQGQLELRPLKQGGTEAVIRLPVKVLDV